MGNNMKQFNLQEFLAHPERKVVTRDCRPVRIICTDSDAEGGPIVAIVTMDDNKKRVLNYYENGTFFCLDSASVDDLFFAPTIVKRWGIVYRNSERLFDTREQAEKWMEEAEEGEKEFCSVCKVEGEEE